MDNDNETPSPLKSLRNMRVEPSPFLAKRVAANFENIVANQKPVKSRRSLWIGAAMAAVLVALAVIPALKPATETPAQAFALNKPYLIRMDIREIPRNEIAYAEISLSGESIQFSSQKFKDIQKNKTIVVDGGNLGEKQYLPVVIEGVSAGDAQVTVSFYNDRHELITTRTMNLAFGGGTI